MDEVDLNLLSHKNASADQADLVETTNGAWGSVSYASSDKEQQLIKYLANLSSEEYLEVMLGPKQVAMTELVAMTVIYVIMFITGVLGNFAVCLVIVKNRSMHTAINYYLFSLAISDLVILLLGLPNELFGFWHQYPYLQGEIFCKIRSYVSELASYASVLTIVSFSVERYLAICHPLHVFETADFPRALTVLAADWTVASLAAIPYLLFTKVNYIDYPYGSGIDLKDSAFCGLLDMNIKPQGYPVHELSFLLFFLLPAGTLLFLYSSMGRSLRGSIGKKNSLTGIGDGSVHGDKHLNSSRKQIIRMLAVVVISFFLCWIPFHAQRLGYVYFKDTHIFRTINEYLMYVSGICYYVSSTINPILYNLMSVKYRQAFKKTLCGTKSTLHLEAFGGHHQGTVRGRTNTMESDQNSLHAWRMRAGNGSVTRNPLPPTGSRKSSAESGSFPPMQVTLKEMQRLAAQRNGCAKPSPQKNSYVKRASPTQQQQGAEERINFFEPVVEVEEMSSSSFNNSFKSKRKIML